MLLYLTTSQYGQWLLMLENKPGSLKVYPISDSLIGFKCQSFKFLNNLVNYQFLPNLSSHLAGRGTIDMNILDGILV